LEGSKSTVDWMPWGEELNWINKQVCGGSMRKVHGLVSGIKYDENGRYVGYTLIEVPEPHYKDEGKTRTNANSGGTSS
jgi:hypothetical protein